MDGVLVIDKPAGMTSHDVVDAVRKRLGTKRVGHAGTLDPDATGLLIVGVGRATRLLSYAQASPKRYSAVARLGVVTSTQDASGEVLSESPVDVTEELVVKTAAEFVGEIEQVPPMVSAVKVGGERLYRKARRGEEVERAARRVTIYDIDLISIDLPAVTMEVTCSAGTYVRTLVHDLGAALGCGAHLASLRRTETGGFGLDEAVALAEVSASNLRPLGEAVRILPSVEIDGEGAALVANGRPLPAPEDSVEGHAVALLHDSELLAVYARRGPELVPERVVAR